ncbi:late competence development ComFB family protein [Paenibacillus hexagrammi]|uniref:Late competence development ComFB family protein n=1 Tax=Paenibacillus hexagrammi TaxID=2908839 RepID=A0ABY3SM44_9BACL|nr:late competence development ComFB family protein [Paenibacillus sp. YPD9-1]UJF35123.1 late competence development ComFB family protein [Paenibacillus sp. YPD9-1]
MVHNLIEDLVQQCLKELQQTQAQLKECDDRLLDDIMAITLNRIPPKYVASNQGEMFVKTQLRQMVPDVYRELSYAIDKVLSGDRKSDF